MNELRGDCQVSLPQIFHKPVPSGDYTRRQPLVERAEERACRRSLRRNPVDDIENPLHLAVKLFCRNEK